MAGESVASRTRRTLTPLAQDLRVRQNEAESLLWTVLRGRRVGGLEFRRQHPVPPYIADFACPGRWLIVELDGGCHDVVVEKDKRGRMNSKQAAGPCCGL